MKSFESIAQEAYFQFMQTLGKSPAEMLDWESLTERTRDAWMAAARTMAEQINQVH